MKMTVDLPEELVREAKILAIQEGKKFKDKMAELFRIGLDLLDAEEEAKPSDRPTPKRRKR